MINITSKVANMIKSSIHHSQFPIQKVEKDAEFSSWEEFHSALSDYEKTKFVAFVVDKSVTIENRNRKIEQANRDRPLTSRNPYLIRLCSTKMLHLFASMGERSILVMAEEFDRFNRK